MISFPRKRRRPDTLTQVPSQLLAGVGWPGLPPAWWVIVMPGRPCCGLLLVAWAYRTWLRPEPVSLFDENHPVRPLRVIW